MENFVKMYEMQTVQLPTFEEVIKNKEWVFWGGDNLWPQHTISLYNYSSINRACINSIRDAVIGKKMLIDGQDASLIMANSFQSIYDVFKRTAMDYVLHTGFALNVIKRRDNEGISEFYHMDLSKLRSGKVNEWDFVKEYYFSADWTNIKKYPPRELPAFDLREEEPSQVYFFMNYSPNQTYYPINEWIGARVSVEVDINIKNFHLQNLQNGFFPSLFISLNNGIPGEEEREQVYRHLLEKYSSTNHAGKMFLNFSNDKEHEPTITPLSLNNSDTFYSQMDEQIRNTILTGHRITSPKLLGIETPGQLGSKDEIIEGYEHFLATNIVPKQELLITEFEKLLFLRDKQTHKIEIIQNELFDKEDEITVQ